ncbi:hypothetical protein [Plastoroseomonas arctica]|uniref:Porin n=1 Tax=Plastoroseomonas arctica TaxID=1509237 RepID=A0AAF1K490_9PROT|nr:hypothetical protein [Plastoroseomonas arctica]MBR0655550.1 hypothetical protein [Plastoroseomonas arctica]
MTCLRLALAALLLHAGVALAQTPEFPRFEGEIDLGAYMLNTRPARGSGQRGTNAFLFGEIGGALHLDPRLSFHATLHIEPLGRAEPQGGTIGLRREGAYLEALNAEFRPVEGLTLVLGKYVVPFGRGHGDFPGVVALFRAHETYLFNEALGVMARATLPLDAEHGEHVITAAAFTRDRSAFSTLLVGNRRRCCSSNYDRYARNTAADGGPGNTGRLDNYALALDGERIALLPGFTYHAALLSRGQGQDGTARE